MHLTKIIHHETSSIDTFHGDFTRLTLLLLFFGQRKHKKIGKINILEENKKMKIHILSSSFRFLVFANV